LRYPNIHTWYFMEVIIYLFGESDAHVQEQIARVLLERVFQGGPSPWGLNLTAMLLFKRSDFWNLECVNCHENIRKTIEDFYTSCTTGQKPTQLTKGIMGSGGPTSDVNVPQKIAQLS